MSTGLSQSIPSPDFFDLWESLPWLPPDPADVVLLEDRVDDAQLVVFELVPVTVTDYEDREIALDFKTIDRVLRQFIGVLRRPVYIRAEPHGERGATLALRYSGAQDIGPNRTFLIRRPDGVLIGRFYLRTTGSFCTTGWWFNAGFREDGSFIYRLYDFDPAYVLCLTRSDDFVNLMQWSLESVRKVYVGLQSFRSMRRIDARRRNASAL